MLVVRRRAGEAIVVAGDVEIEVIEISRTRVKLGITAPRQVEVLRREAIAAATDNRSAAALLAPGALKTDLLQLLTNVSSKITQKTPGPADM
jgi:carbon storage regulator